MRVSPYRLVLGMALAGGIAWCSGWLIRTDTDFGSPFGTRGFVAMDGGGAPPSLDLRPIDGSAYRVLAQEAQARVDLPRAMALYRIAVRRDPRDWRARAWLLDDAFAHGRSNEGVDHLDAMLRVAPELRAPLLHALVPELHDPQLRKEIVTRLAAQPPWSGAFLHELRDAYFDPDLRAETLDDLAALRPLSSSELSTLLRALIASGRVAEARNRWLQSLPSDQRRLASAVFDGDFEESEPIEGEFAWTWDAGPGVDLSLERGQAASGDQSLRIDFSGRAISLRAPSQRLALSPGHYALTAAFADATTASRPFELSVACVPGNTIERVELAGGAPGNWKRISSDFDIPVGCAEQRLALVFTARSRADAQIAGVLRLDAVAIRNSLP